MNLERVRNNVEIDLRLSPADTVLYLEGKSDIDYLFALLGKQRPPDDGNGNFLLGGVLVKEPRNGSGSIAVKSHVELGKHFIKDGLVVGIVDGDGLPLPELASNFDPPHPGPLFSWKAYSIENLVAKTGWPTTWGNEPDWLSELRNYGPLVALNRVGSQARTILEELGIDKYNNPIQGAPLPLGEEIAKILAVGKARLLSFDVEQRFLDELSSFEAVILRSLDEAHALLNGKWLFRHLAPTLTKRDAGVCEFEWLAHARSVGGLPEVREWWERVTGNPP